MCHGLQLQGSATQPVSGNLPDALCSFQLQYDDAATFLKNFSVLKSWCFLWSPTVAHIFTPWLLIKKRYSSTLEDNYSGLCMCSSVKLIDMQYEKATNSDNGLVVSPNHRKSNITAKQRRVYLHSYKHQVGACLYTSFSCLSLSLPLYVLTLLVLHSFSLSQSTACPAV